MVVKRVRKLKTMADSIIFKWWMAFAILLTITLGLETVIHIHTDFEIQKFKFFHAIYGFIACFSIVLFSKFLGFFLKRKDNYYQGGRRGK